MGGGRLVPVLTVTMRVSPTTSNTLGSMQQLVWMRVIQYIYVIKEKKPMKRLVSTVILTSGESGVLRGWMFV